MQTSRTPTRARRTANSLWGEALLTTAEAPTDCNSCHAWIDDERLANRQSPTFRLPPTQQARSTTAVPCQAFAAATCGGGTKRLRSRRGSGITLPLSRQVSLGVDAAGSHQVLSVPMTLPRNDRYARTFSCCRQNTGVPHQVDQRCRTSCSSSHDASQTSDPELPAYLPLQFSAPARVQITPALGRLDNDYHSSDSGHSGQGPMKQLLNNASAGSGFELDRTADSGFSGWDAYISDASDESDAEPIETETAGVRCPVKASQFHSSSDESCQIQAPRRSALRGGRVEVQAPGHARKPDALRKLACQSVKRHLFQSGSGRLSSSCNEEGARSGTINPLVRENSFTIGALSGPADQHGSGLIRMASKERLLVRPPHTVTAQTAVSRISRSSRHSNSSRSSSRGGSAARWQQSVSASQRTAPAALEVNGRSSRTLERRGGPRQSIHALHNATSVSSAAEDQVAFFGATIAANEDIHDMMTPSLASQRTSRASTGLSFKETSSAQSTAFNKHSNFEFELDTDAMGGGGFRTNGLFEEVATITAPKADLGDPLLLMDTTPQAAVSERPAAIVVPLLGKQTTAKKRSKFRSMLQRQRTQSVFTTVFT